MKAHIVGGGFGGLAAAAYLIRVRFGRFIGMVSGEENTFFLRVRGTRRHRGQAHGRSRYPADRRLQGDHAAETRSYAAALSVLVVAEWLYLDPQPTSSS